MEAMYDLKEKAKSGKVTAVEIVVWEWLDRTYGNSYFNAVVKIACGNMIVRQYLIPFNYG